MTMPNEEHSFDAALSIGVGTTAAVAESAVNAFRVEYLATPQSQIAKAGLGAMAAVAEAMVPMVQDVADMVRQPGGNMSPEGIRKIVAASEGMAKAIEKWIGVPKEAPAIGGKVKAALSRSLDLPPLDELRDKAVDKNKDPKGNLLSPEQFKALITPPNQRGK